MILGVELDRNEKGFYCNFITIDAENGLVKTDTTKNTGSFTLKDMAQLLISYVNMKKPKQIVIDKYGSGLVLFEEFVSLVNNSLDIAVKCDGKLFYEK